MFQCLNDAYCPDCEEYETIQDFADMCLACFGFAPTLYQDAAGHYRETGTHEVVLVQVDLFDPTEL